MHRRQGILKARGAIEQHHAITFADAAVGEALLVGGIGRSAFGAQQQALFARDIVECSGNLLVGDCDGKTLALAHRAQNEKISDRLRHANPRSNRVRILPARRVLDAVLEGPHHRCAALRLHRDHARALRADEADGLELGKSLPHADQAGAAAGRIEDHVGHVPAELLGKLQPHRLLALDAVGLLQGRGIEPADLCLALADDLAAIVDQTVDAVDGRALQLDLADIDLGRIGRAEDGGLDAAGRRIGRERRARIAIGRHRHVLDAERLAHRHRHDEAAGLERACRQPPFILDDDLAAAELFRKPWQADQRRRDFAEADDVLAMAHRQQLAVAPHVGGALSQRVLGQGLLDPGKIVTDQQRLAGLGEIVDLVGRIVVAFHRAFEMGDEGRALDGEIVVVFHGLSSFSSASGVASSREASRVVCVALDCFVATLLAMMAGLDVQDAPVGVEHRFLHHLRQGRMREHRVHQLLFGRLQVHGDHIALDQLGNLGADHVGP